MLASGGARQPPKGGSGMGRLLRQRSSSYSRPTRSAGLLGAGPKVAQPRAQQNSAREAELLNMKSGRVIFFCLSVCLLVGYTLVFHVACLQYVLNEDENPSANAINVDINNLARMEESLRQFAAVCSDPATQKYLHDSYMIFMFREERAPKNVFGADSWTYVKILHRQRLGWCKVPKAGSTSMAASILTSLTETDRDISEDKAHDMFQLLSSDYKFGQNYTDYNHFIIVRHPFSRLFSAYKDKFHGAPGRERTMFMKVHGLPIIKKYRKEKNLNPSYQKTPTLQEFLEYLVDTDPYKYDIHWCPTYLLCDHCQLKYKTIMHVESLEEDFPHFRLMTGLNLQLKHLHNNENITDVKTPNTNTTVDSSDALELDERSMFSTIPKTLLEKVFQIFKLDFELFGYAIHPYDSYTH